MLLLSQGSLLRYPLCFWFIKAMRKCGEFKISLPNPRCGKTLNPTTNDREPMVGGSRRDRGLFKMWGILTVGAW